jgi:ParB-like chromosome segregation protein Spo0J
MPEKQTALLQFIVKNQWSVRQAEQFVVAAREVAKGTQAAKKRTATTTPSTEKLSKKIGTKVSIRRRATGGILEIPFKGDAELTKIMRYLNKS